MPAQSAVSAVEDDIDDDGNVYYDGAEDAGGILYSWTNIFPWFSRQHLGCVLYKCAYYIQIFMVLTQGKISVPDPICGRAQPQLVEEGWSLHL